MIARGSFTALSAAAVLALSACGGGDASEPAAATPPATATPAAAEPAKPKKVRQSVNFPVKFEQRVETKCKRVGKRATAIIRGRYTPERFRQLRDLYEALADDFDGMNAPARNKRAWRTYRLALRNSANFIGLIESDVAELDRSGFERRARKAPVLDGRMLRLSNRYGFKNCADD